PRAVNVRLTKQAYSRVALMVTNIALRFLEGHEADECNCPACVPACERTGRKCFIACNRCRTNVEVDNIGPLKTTTRHVHHTATSSRRRVIEVSPELRELMHLLKAIEAHAADVPDEPCHV